MQNEPKAMLVSLTGPRAGTWAAKRQEETAKAYAMARGFHERECDIVGLQSGIPLFDEAHSGIVGRLSAGDHLIVARFDVLHPHPSCLAQGIAELIARGVTVHVLEVGGDVLQHLTALRAAWAAAWELEKELIVERRRHQEELDAVRADADEGLKLVVAEMIRRYGVPKDGVPTLSELGAMQNRPIEERQRGVLAAAEQEAAAAAEREREAKLIEQEADERVGAYLRALRDRRGWRLDDMGKMLGVSAATLSRLEKHGTGAALASALALLDPGANANDRAALRRRAKAALVAPDAEPEPEPTEAVFAMAAPEASPEPAA